MSDCDRRVAKCGVDRERRTSATGARIGEALNSARGSMALRAGLEPATRCLEDGEEPEE